MIFFSNLFLSISSFKIEIVENLASQFVFFFLSLYKVNMDYGFAKVTQVVLVYEFGGLSFFF